MLNELGTLKQLLRCYGFVSMEVECKVTMNHM